MNHSVIWGPWMPEELVNGISVSWNRRLLTTWSAPAEVTWTNLRFGASEGEGGKVEKVTRIVISLKFSMKCQRMLAIESRAWKYIPTGKSPGAVGLVCHFRSKYLISMWGYFFLMRSSIAVGSGHGRANWMISRAGPPPIVASVVMYYRWRWSFRCKSTLLCYLADSFIFTFIRALQWEARLAATARTEDRRHQERVMVGR